jgi:LacI family transcriptional regulator
MATIYDVARRARVSTYTVSTVLNRTGRVSPELTERVLQAVKALDYTVNDLARGLQTRRTRTVGMLIPDIGNPFYAKVVRGAEDVLRQAGYALLLGNMYNDPAEQARYIALFKAKQVDGLLLFVAPGADRVPVVGKPSVFVGRAPRLKDVDLVAADNTKGTDLAVTHLLCRGHRRIAIVTGHRALSASVERVAGWRCALRRAGVAADRRLIGEGDWTAESGHRVTVGFLALTPRPTAIFASNFLMMTGTLRALQEHAVAVPAEIEVMSSDDSEWLDVFSPHISTVLQPSYEMGSRAAELLLERFATPDRAAAQIRLVPALRIRNGLATKLSVDPASTSPVVLHVRLHNRLDSNPNRLGMRRTA